MNDVIQFFDVVPNRFLYFISAVIFILIILKIEITRRIRKANLTVKQLIKDEFRNFDFKDLSENKNDDLYSKIFAIKGLKYFNIIHLNGETLEYKFGDSKDLFENHLKVRESIANFRKRGNNNKKMLKEANGYIFIYSIKTNLFFVLFLSKINYSEIFYKK